MAVPKKRRSKALVKINRVNSVKSDCIKLNVFGIRLNNDFKKKNIILM
jgi:hypothetical protein